MTGLTVRLVGEKQRELAKRLVDRAPPMATVTIREEVRSLAQNARLWASLTDIARARPNGRNHTTEQWKAIFMAACGHKPIFVPSLDGQDFICLGYKSSRLSKYEMSDLLECIIAYGAENGVEFSEPNPWEQAE